MNKTISKHKVIIPIISLAVVILVIGIAYAQTGAVPNPIETVLQVLAKIEAKLDKAIPAIGNITIKLDKIESKLDKNEPGQWVSAYQKIEAKLDKVERKLDTTTNPGQGGGGPAVQKIEAKLDRLEAKADNTAQITEILIKLNTKLDYLEAKVDRLEAKIDRTGQ